MRVQNVANMVPVLTSSNIAKINSNNEKRKEKFSVLKELASEVIANTNFSNLLFQKNKLTVQKSFENNKIENNIDHLKQTVILSEDEDRGFKYVLTKDKELLDQYYQLRNEIFQVEMGWNKKTWFENEYDKNGNIFLALTDKNEVIGGLRIMMSINNQYLSDENPGTNYTYRNLLKFLDLDSTQHYMEIDGFVVKKGYRDRHVAARVGSYALDYAKSAGCKYLIAIAALATCRNDRVLLRNLGYQEIYIAKSFPWTELECYNYSKDYPIVGVLEKSN